MIRCTRCRQPPARCRCARLDAGTAFVLAALASLTIILALNIVRWIVT